MANVLIDFRRPVNGQLVRYDAPSNPTGGNTDPGSDPTDPGDRSTLVAGAYEPDATNTGLLPGWSVDAADTAFRLIPYGTAAVDKVTIPANAVLNNRVIYGDVTFAGAATLTNCLLVGGRNWVSTGNLGVISCNNTRTGIAVLTDCELKPRVESDGRDCALGRQYELYRCHLSGGVDGCGVYSNTSSVPNANVKIVQCLIEDLSYWYPDRDHTGAGTADDGAHQDCIQYQGGKAVLIRGNSLRGTAHLGVSTNLDGGAVNQSQANPKKPWLLSGGRTWANGACVIVQDNVSGTGTWGRPDNTVIVELNWFRGGLAHLNIKSTAPVWICRNNKHHRDTAIRPSGATGEAHGGYWIRFQRSSTNTIDGLTTGTLSNRWVDGTLNGTALAGTLLAEPRLSGIEDDYFTANGVR